MLIKKRFSFCFLLLVIFTNSFADPVTPDPNVWLSEQWSKFSLQNLDYYGFMYWSNTGFSYEDYVDECNGYLRGGMYQWEYLRVVLNIVQLQIPPQMPIASDHPLRENIKNLRVFADSRKCIHFFSWFDLRDQQYHYLSMNYLFGELNAIKQPASILLDIFLIGYVVAMAIFAYIGYQMGARI